MRRLSFSFLLGTLGLLGLGLGTLCHGEARILVPNIPPYAYEAGGEVKGVAYELVREMARRVGHSGKVELMPLPRIMETIRLRPDVVTMLAGGAKLDPGVNWLVKLMDEPMLLVLDRRSGVEVSSLEAARQLRVGVQAGSPAEQMARAQGFTQLETVPVPEHNANKLALHRIDAWLVAWPVAQAAQQKARLPLANLRRGLVVGTVSGYLVASLRFDPAEADKWKAAVEAMRRDGSYASIVSHYHFTPLP
jgi:polar amino acid transport system substrate-binding protein